ncbi:MAG: alpha/beta hydrolase [Deltaproteobacteria bacterium]|jgi:pimeloyl-ACP methyl ester carboxylesterase|nr:alpha/beta hydrolase [Deltaproteobacteria bacterium]
MFIKVNNVQIFYKKSGSGPPLLLLHGNGEDHHIFDKISLKLAATFTLYAIDSRNHGESERTNEFSYESMAEDIFHFIKDLNLGPSNILGFSDGAILALFLALKKAPLRKMALLGVNLNPSDFTAEFHKFIQDTYEKNQDPLFKLMLTEPNIDPESLKHLEIPSLVVAGENDIFKPEVFTLVAEKLPQATLKIISGHTHESYIVDNDLLAQDFLDFFA